MIPRRTIIPVVLLVFVIYPLICLYPYGNNLLSELSGIDDWNRYARFALDIKHNGISIPSVHEDYFAPAGFLYNYFLALCFCLFGENTVPVYILQNLMLGISILLIYFTFEKKLKPFTSFVFLLALITFAFLDIARYYTFRFLSENFSIFLLSVFVFCIGRKEKPAYLYFASFILGLSVLSRPNLLLFAFLFFMALGYFLYKGWMKGNVFITLISFISAFSLLLFRNLYVTGNLTLLPVEGIHFIRETFTGLSLILLLKKILFCLGILSPLDQALSIRPHWLLMWVFYSIYLVLKWRSKEKMPFEEIIVHLLIFSYFGSLVLVAPVINSYGYRLLLPAVLYLLPFGIMAIETIRHKKKSSFLH
jgi:hypothetical protein